MTLVAKPARGGNVGEAAIRAAPHGARLFHPLAAERLVQPLPHGGPISAGEPGGVEVKLARQALRLRRLLYAEGAADPVEPDRTRLGVVGEAELDELNRRSAEACLAHSGIGPR